MTRLNPCGYNSTILTSCAVFRLNDILRGHEATLCSAVTVNNFSHYGRSSGFIAYWWQFCCWRLCISGFNMAPLTSVLTWILLFILGIRVERGSSKLSRVDSLRMRFPLGSLLGPQ